MSAMSFPLPEAFSFNSHRSPVYARSGLVAASQPLAVAAGTQLLSQGGCAADAALAAAAALAVTEPTSTGLGGDCFALYYQASQCSVSALNGSGRLPAGLTLERLRREGMGKELPPLHPYTVTVPGACAGWCDLHARFGRLPLAQVLDPAIHLAEYGFPVAPITAYFWERGMTRQLSRSPAGMELTIDGHAPQPGEIFRNPGMAHALRLIAERGATAFYEGEIGEAVVKVVQAAGGCLSQSDLAAHTSTWETPISSLYREWRIWEAPPNGQGLAALLALNLLEGFDISALPHLSAARLHLEIEAMRLAFADARWYVSDPAFSQIPLDELLSRVYANQRRRLIDPHRAATMPQRGTPPAGSDTVYLSVVDGEGNACSFINSNYMGFGTGIVPTGWGFSLQNRGHGFSLQPDHPNALAPGKRPYHTIIPALITRPGGETGEDLFACLGVMGGFMQPQGHLQVVVALLDDALDPQSALDRPRFCLDPEQSDGMVSLEEGFPLQLLSDLEKMGHPVRLVSGMERALFGRGQIILRHALSGVLVGGSDPRADGCVMCP